MSPPALSGPLFTSGIVEVRLGVPSATKRASSMSNSGGPSTPASAPRSARMAELGRPHGLHGAGRSASLRFARHHEAARRRGPALMFTRGSTATTCRSSATCCPASPTARPPSASTFKRHPQLHRPRALGGAQAACAGGEGRRRSSTSTPRTSDLAPPCLARASHHTTADRCRAASSTAGIVIVPRSPTTGTYNASYHRPAAEPAGGRTGRQARLRPGTCGSPSGPRQAQGARRCRSRCASGLRTLALHYTPRRPWARRCPSMPTSSAVAGVTVRGGPLSRGEGKSRQDLLIPAEDRDRAWKGRMLTDETVTEGPFRRVRGITCRRPTRHRCSRWTAGPRHRDKPI